MNLYILKNKQTVFRFIDAFLSLLADVRTQGKEERGIMTDGWIDSGEEGAERTGSRRG